ncbi:short-chain dehydrogenase/reductase-like protein [Amylocarpus encephaloides]|uniref:Short-chain dehydrogenase/reductase-like protein n=1 Tax=Amylocarpus encephaloides TaxID=45428 RepID=A0A9P7YIX4_9HELO|nr:short-chain dehydrogenase/reductase-like protein [Amylocarpus encephaloides]
MFNLPAGFLTTFLKSQLFTKLPCPETPLTDQVIIITGSNVGLGLEAARHFVGLDAAKVILGCRSISKGEAALADIEHSTGRKGVVELWEVDMSNYQSVEAFCARVESEERIDVVVENAGIAVPNYEEVEGTESTIAVNVVATFLMAVLMVPVLRRTAERFSVTPRLVIVASDAHEQASFVEGDSPPGGIFSTMAQNDPKLQPDRYNTSKLLQILVVRELAPLLTRSTSPSQDIIINTLTPGLCHSALMRHAVFPLNVLAAIGKTLLARSTEVGSRTLFSAAVAGRETHGCYMADCVVREPSAYVRSAKGAEVQKRVWKELREILEDVKEGSTSCLKELS